MSANQIANINPTAINTFEGVNLSYSNFCLKNQRCDNAGRKKACSWLFFGKIFQRLCFAHFQYGECWKMEDLLKKTNGKIRNMSIISN
jgi:hypothetical protein